MKNQVQHRAAAFSLVEVIIAVGIVALAIPSLLAVFGFFSDVSVSTNDRDDAESVTRAVMLFLENEAGNTSASDTTIDAAGSFATVYQWVVAARGNPDDATVLYAYKPRISDSGSTGTGETDSGYVASATPPTEDQVSSFDGRIMAVEIHAPETNILPDTVLVPDVSNYVRAYLPMKLEIYALFSATEERTNTKLVETFPVVLSR
jgi:type II secretory pathway pseudopilin PulG